MESIKYIFVIAGGPMENREFLKLQVEALHPVELICADGGARHLNALGLTPDVIIGDMDSLSPEILHSCEKRGSRILKYPQEKDETDTQLALDYALKLHPDEILIFGGLGGRIDHTLANISLLVRIAGVGTPAKLVDEWCEVFVVNRHAEIKGIPGQTVSLFPLSSVVCGIELEGFEYSLSGATMEIGASYGVSNRLMAVRGIISVESGYLLAIRYYKPGVFPVRDLT
jgi:thiamine pyrophosphokinase